MNSSLKWIDELQAYLDLLSRKLNTVKNQVPDISVDIEEPADGQLLIYDGTDHVWKNATLSITHYTETVIYDTPITATGDVTVTDYSDANMLMFEVGIYAESMYQKFECFLTLDSFKSSDVFYIGGSIGSGSTAPYSAWFGVKYKDATTITVSDTGKSKWTQQQTIYKISKIKY